MVYFGFFTLRSAENQIFSTFFRVIRYRKLLLNLHFYWLSKSTKFYFIFFWCQMLFFVGYFVL